METSRLSPHALEQLETEPELHLTVRFSASIPDVQLEITNPTTTTATGLKQLIRQKLPRDLADHRLRLIYSGRGLEDAVSLATSLKLSSPRAGTPISTRADVERTKDEISKGKGKAVAREIFDIPRLYIHCSIGDIVLSASDLDAEAAMASTLQQGNNLVPEPTGEQKSQKEESLTTPAPRGFDRLLAAGFTPSEISALRSQFLALQSVSYTPDTMPSGAELRELEDRWMDEGSGAMGAGALGGGATTLGSGDDDGGGLGSGSHGALDDMLWGAIMGFFWPIGCAMWLRREEGVWSWRKGLAVFVGVVVNIAFGAVRVMN
ncbi:putative conserved membrane protein [Talaromyces proteolyticus]|uniref:Conserved membrane protein n=1 Tax=Talaromyces proteolyticus TaxID=1131652 RepID=A0AAD4Q0K3_9EURO|nr:putative conserved membrane protein [Talaromyces proteolyticus]KAH8697682.1 putative conserved membrane protein [Talaromyces proteolyticus]